jgi:hypothetical protein
MTPPIDPWDNILSIITSTIDKYAVIIKFKADGQRIYYGAELFKGEPFTYIRHPLANGMYGHEFSSKEELLPYLKNQILKDLHEINIQEIVIPANAFNVNEQYMTEDFEEDKSELVKDIVHTICISKLEKI